MLSKVIKNSSFPPRWGLYGATFFALGPTLLPFLIFFLAVS